MEKRTPLYDLHAAAGGRLVLFAGYLLPIQYASILAEHNAVRQKAGLFDVSHMGEIILSGPGALATLQQLLCNDYSGMNDGTVRYSPMLNPDGGIIDDLLVYKKSDLEYLLVVNASNHDKDAAWISSHLQPETKFYDVSERIAQMALQGPLAQEILEKICKKPLPEKYYTFQDNVPLCGASCLISRTGYTGEDGFEIYCQNENAPAIWSALIEAGAPLGLIPCGLGARDTLRSEAAMPLYGHEMTEEITPYEAGLSYFVKSAQKDFIGKTALIGKEKPSRKRFGLKITGRGIAREHCPVFLDGAEIGIVTTGVPSTTLGYPIAMALLPVDKVCIGQEVEVDVRGRKITAEIVKLPFYKRSK